MKFNANFIIGDDGRRYYNPGDSQHTHMILVTPEDRIQLLESTVSSLEERIATLEKMLDDQ